MTPNAVRAAVAPAPSITTPWSRIKRVLPFLGPAFVASVAYMDPGNFATNIQAGADFGYMLLWVLVASNLMAILIQSLSAKLGIASGLTLPQAIRANTTRRMRIGLWLAAESAAMATDLAEFLGAAIGMQILFGLGLLPSALLTAVISFALLAVQRYGHVRFEFAIMAFVAVIGAAFVVEIFMSNPDPAGVLHGMFVPGIQSSAIYVAVAMVGATVMPHVVYLHSGLVQHRADILERREQARALPPGADRHRARHERRVPDQRLDGDHGRGGLLPRRAPTSRGSRTPTPRSGRSWARWHRPRSGSRSWPRGSRRPRSGRWPGR